jgi:hypothetical protein
VLFNLKKDLRVFPNGLIEIVLVLIGKWILWRKGALLSLSKDIGARTVKIKIVVNTAVSINIKIILFQKKRIQLS